MIAPIVITILTVLYLLGFFCLALWVEDMPWGAYLVLAIGALAAIGVAVFVLWERIKEIRSGEEDDLSKY